MLSSSEATNASLDVAIEVPLVGGGRTPRHKRSDLARRVAPGLTPSASWLSECGAGGEGSHPSAGNRWGARPSGQVRRSLGELSARRLAAKAPKSDAPVREDPSGPAPTPL